MRRRHHEMMRATVACITLNMLLGAGVPTAFAELKEISDAQMGDVVGQSVFRVDSFQDGNIKTTRASLQMDVETEVNINQATFGIVDKVGATTGADIDAANLTLSKLDSGSIESFIAQNPYIEIAKENGQTVGLRIGFENAQGSLLGNISSFSGNLGMQVVDGNGKVQPTFLLNDLNKQVESRATRVGVVIVPDPVTQPGDLPTLPTSPATADPTFGDDPQMAADIAPAPLPEQAPELVTNQISNFETFNIGDGTTSQMAQDFFISIQSQAMSWKSSSGGTISAAPGFHLNIPEGTPISLDQFKAGIPRADIGMTRGSSLF